MQLMYLKALSVLLIDDDNYFKYNGFSYISIAIKKITRIYYLFSYVEFIGFLHKYQKYAARTDS